MIAVTTAACGNDPDDDKVRVVINGIPLGPERWPSEAATIVSWLEKTIAGGSLADWCNLDGSVRHILHLHAEVGFTPAPVDQPQQLPLKETSE